MGGGGGARLGPTADGRGGGVGRCAPIWVLINPLALVRDDQSLWFKDSAARLIETFPSMPWLWLYDQL